MALVGRELETEAHVLDSAERITSDLLRLGIAFLLLKVATNKAEDSY